MVETTAFKKSIEKKKTNKGFGIFAKSDIVKGSVIFEFIGEVIDRSKVPNPLTPENDHYLQIGKDTYIGPSGNLDQMINHSCNPNAAVYIVGHRAFVKSLCLITAGSEITFDYSTTSSDTPEEWKLDCLCGSFNCRKTISGYHSLDEATKTKYKELGLIPSYLTAEEK